MKSVIRVTVLVLAGLFVIQMAARFRNDAPAAGAPAPVRAPTSAGGETAGESRALIRRRIENSPHTYLGYSLAETDSMLRRWPDRAGTPLRIYVSPASTTPDHREAARRAFRRWERVGAIPVPFAFVRDSAEAEVVVRWVESFSSDRSGQADVFWDQDGWLVSAVLTLALRSREGWNITPDVTYVVALHEIGHLLGLGHSDDPRDLMYPMTEIHDLTSRDRETARLLYALPAGSVRTP